MLSEDEIPPSPPVKHRSTKVRKRVKTSPQSRSKRSKFSLKRYDNLNQDQVITKSTTSSRNDFEKSLILEKPEELPKSLDNGIQKVEDFREKNVNIYQSSTELDDEAIEQNRIVNYNVLSSVRLLEKANVSNSSTPVRQPNILANDPGLIPLKEMIESESLADLSSFESTQPVQSEVKAAQCPKTPSGIDLDTQFFVTESQLWRVCSIADEVTRLHSDPELSQWVENRPIEQDQQAIDTMPTKPAELSSCQENMENPIVQTILRDFEVNSPQTGHQKTSDSSIKNDNELLSTQSLILKKRNIRTYSRTRPPLKPENLSRRFISNFDDDDSSDSSAEVKYEDFVSHLDESNEPAAQPAYCLPNNDIEIDINTSQKIFENLHNLSNYYFSQSKVFDEEDKENVSSKSTETPTAIDVNAEPPVKNDIIKKETQIQSDLKQSLSHISLLDEDDDIFESIKSQQPLSQYNKRNNEKRMCADSTPSSSRNHVLYVNSGASTSTPVAESKFKDFPFPKRLRFDTEMKFNEMVPGKEATSTTINSFGASGGFSTARGQSIKISDQGMQKWTKMFDEIQNENDDYLVPKPLRPDIFSAFKTGSDLDPFGGLRTGSDSGSGLAKHSNILQQNSTDLEKPKSIKSVSFGDFKTGSGKNIKLTEDRIRISAMLFEEEIDTGGTILGPTVSDVAQSSFRKTNVSSAQGFTTGRGQIIKVSQKALHKTGSIFKNIDPDIPSDVFDENLFESAFCGSKKGQGCCNSVSSTSKNLSTRNTDESSINQCEIGCSAIETPSIQDTLPQAFPSQMNTAEFLAEVYKTPINLKSAKNHSLSTSTPINSSRIKHSCDKQQLCNSHQVTIPGQSTMITEDSVDFLDKEVIDQLFVDAFLEKSQKQADNRDQIKQVCLTNKFESALNDSKASLSVNHQDNSNISITVTEEIKEKRRQSFIEQQERINNRTKKVHPHPGSMYLEKTMSTSKMSLSGLGTPATYTIQQLESYGLCQSTLEFDMLKASVFKFNMTDFYPMSVCETNTDGIQLADDMTLIMDQNAFVGIDALKSSFLNCPAVDPKLVPSNWIENALKWIILKLASYELHFPQQFAKKALTPENVLVQLKFRYYREIDRAERSALRKIVEGDDIPSKRLVLFVSNIIETELECTLELSDGWYAMKTVPLDIVLRRAVRCGKIKTGTKVIMQGAELCGATIGHPPLELPDSVRLKIHGNSTRRAKWNTKLGYYRHSFPFSLSLSSIDENGGAIARVTVLVLRVYPRIFLHKIKSEGASRTVLQSQQVEKRQNISEDQKRLEMIERLYNEVTIEVEKEYANRTKAIKAPNKKLKDIDDAEEIWEYLEYSRNPADSEMELSHTQHKMATDYYSKMYNEKMDEISCRVRERINLTEERPKSTPMLKIRVVDARQPTASKTAILCIWGAEESHDEITENRFYDIRNMSASKSRGNNLQISAGRNTVFRDISQSLSQMREIHLEMRRRCIDIAEVTSKDFKPFFHEFDTVGYVLMIDEVEPKFQSVFLVNAAKKAFCVKFWNSISKFAYDDVIQVGRFLAIKNIEWRSADALDRRGNCQGFATQLTTFTENPKTKLLTDNLDRLKREFKEISDMEAFETEARGMVEQMKLANRSSTSTPLRILNTSNTSNPSPTSSVHQKINKLSTYGQPPPLSPLILNHSLNESVRRPFKIPLND